MSKTGELIKKYDFTFRKKFGQNFLTDPGIVEKIVDASLAGPEDTVKDRDRPAADADRAAVLREIGDCLTVVRADRPLRQAALGK